jgi:hypothetical protein
MKDSLFDWMKEIEDNEEEIQFEEPKKEEWEAYSEKVNLPDGTEIEVLSSEEVRKLVVPDSLLLPNEPNRIEVLKSAMQKEISDYREAVAEDESYCQGEADEELYLSLVRRLYKERFTLVSKLDGKPCDNAKDTTINVIWNAVKDFIELENYLIVWDEEVIPVPTDQKDFERFGDFVRYVARQYGISYQL